MNALWLYLRFASLQLDLLYQEAVAADCTGPATTANKQQNRAICLIDNQNLQVCQLNQAATEAGIRQGHNISLACALCAEVQLLPYQPELEHNQLQQIAVLLYQFCGDIALDPPASLWLRVDPVLQLYGGFPALLQLLRQQLPGLQILLGAGTTAAAARLLAFDQPLPLPLLPAQAFGTTAQHKSEHAQPARPEVSPELQQLASLLQGANPALCALAASPLPTAVLQQLNALGIVRLEQLLALPTAELGRRFPKSLWLYLQELTGLRPAKLDFYQPPELFSDKLELLYQCEYVAQLQGPLTLLLKKLQTYLQQRAQHCYLLQLQLILREGEPIELHIQSAQGEYQHQRWLSLCQLRLEQLKLKAPVIQLELCALQSCLRPEQALALFDRSLGALTTAQLQSLLLAKFGPQQLFQLNTVAEHRPFKANQCLSLPAHSSNMARHYSQSKPQPNTLTKQHQAITQPPLLRPALLLTEPVPLQAQVELQPGIERIVSGWWDGQAIERDYQIGRNAQGQWCWLFKDKTGWYLEGYFA